MLPGLRNQKSLLQLALRTVHGSVEVEVLAGVCQTEQAFLPEWGLQIICVCERLLNRQTVMDPIELDKATQNIPHHTGTSLLSTRHTRHSLGQASEPAAAG